MAEFTHQDGVFPPGLGLGLLTSNKQGTSTIETAFANSWYRGGTELSATKCVGCSSNSTCLDEHGPNVCKRRAKTCRTRAMRYFCARTCGVCGGTITKSYLHRFELGGA